jgi:phosphocarrier protein HPr
MEGTCRMSTTAVEREVVLANKEGLHMRPAMQFVDLANRFSSAITVRVKDRCVDGKSIMHVTTLAAGFGDSLRLTAEGADAREAIEALVSLVLSKFDEE